MGRERLAEKSMMAHFRIDINQKKFLTALARKLGKRKNFSALVRDAIEQYIQRLQEEEWLSGDLMLGDQEVFPKANFYFQILSKNLSDLEKQEADLKEWLFKKRIGQRRLHDLACVHHCDPITDIICYSQVVRDEKHGGGGVKLFGEIP